MRKWLAIGFLLLLVNTAYIAAFAEPTVFYMANVLLHLALGIAVFALFLTVARSFGFAALALSVAAALGISLAITGATRQFHSLLVAHVAAAAVGLAALIPYAVRWRPALRNAYAAALALLVLLPLGARIYNAKFPDASLRIHNPAVVPVSMKEEGGGPKSPFWPSSSRTNVGGTIPSNFFMDSKACGECHKDIYKQWNGSMHHFASFNNQFYRKSIEYMQSVAGVQPTKWCAGCHDHAVFFNGRFERPIKDQIDTPEAQNGLGCMSCHSIVHVASSMGNADFTMMYPPLHELASSKNPFIRAMDHF